MKVKLDENLGERGARILREGGCDVATVVAQDLCAASDDTLIEVCRAIDNYRIREFVENDAP